MNTLKFYVKKERGIFVARSDIFPDIYAKRKKSITDKITKMLSAARAEVKVDIHYHGQVENLYV